MSRRGNPHDNAQAKSFIKTLKVEAVYVGDYETFENVVADLPTFIEDIHNATRLHSALGYLSSNTFEKINAPDGSKSAELSVQPQGRSPWLVQKKPMATCRRNDV